MAPRWQSGLAVSADGLSWSLINASPDLPAQITRFLAPTSETVRYSPIDEIFLTNADLDHVLGLLSLRENREPLEITAPADVRRHLCEDLPIGRVLDSFCGVVWHEPASRERNGLIVEPVPLKSGWSPLYAGDRPSHVVGYVATDVSSGKKAGFFPDLAVLDDELLAVLRGCDAVFIDGAFWQEDEMSVRGISSRTAAQMGHVPISASMEPLAALQLPFCAYLHINNTNPVLLPDSPERREVERRGLLIAEDGQSLIL